MYKVCNQPIEQVGPTTAISQQWQIAQRENRGNENMADSTITDLQLFINSHRKKRFRNHLIHGCKRDSKLHEQHNIKTLPHM